MTQEDRSELPALEAQRSMLGWIKCPGCGGSFKFSDRRAWTGYRHTGCGQRLMITNVDRQAEPVWCVVAKVSDLVTFAEDGEIPSGTKHFPAGARVYCFPPQPGVGYENIKVIGRHRGSIQFAEMVLPSKWLVDCRAKLVYGPYLLDRLSGHWDGSDESRKLARELADAVNSRNAGIDRL
jgi:hypothetical protein